MKRKLTRENVEMPVKIGLGFYFRKNGKLWIGNRANAECLASRLSARKTKNDRLLWEYSIFQGVSYFRISFCGQREII
jgi:hypothetical protein